MTNNINLTKAQTPTPIDEPLFVLYREDVPDYKNINGWTLIDNSRVHKLEEVSRPSLERNFHLAAALLAAYDEHEAKQHSDLIVTLTAIIVENDPEIDPNKAVESAKALIKAGVYVLPAAN